MNSEKSSLPIIVRCIKKSLHELVDAVAMESGTDSLHTFIASYSVWIRACGANACPTSSMATSMNFVLCPKQYLYLNYGRTVVQIWAGTMIHV